ncbi:hypothetical protein ACP4OV_023932 [Aristida adscensionis]
MFNDWSNSKTGLPPSSSPVPPPTRPPTYDLEWCCLVSFA